MKKQILKIAGVKSEKEFYKKYPTEEAFMKAHGKAFKKAQIGTYMQSGEAPAPFVPLDTYGIQSDINYAVTGMTDVERRQLEALSGGSQQEQDSAQLMALASALSESGAAKKGKKIPKAQGGARSPIPTGGLPRVQIPTAQQLTAGTSPAASGLADKISATPTATKQKINWAKGIPVLGQVIGGIQKIKEQKRQYETAQQQKQLTDVFAQAAASRPVQQPRRQYLRPEDMAFQPEEMFPTYGVGTNVLAEFGASVGGGEIMNTYAPNTLYDNLGYEPLNDSERYKQFYHGGKMHTAKTGVEQFLGSSQGQGLATALGGGDTGGGWGDILGGVGGLAGGPIGFAARFVGTAIDRQKQKKIENQQRLTTQNIGNMLGQSTGMAIQSMNRSHMEDGGTTSPYQWVSHTWQPQVITTFGEHKVKDLLRPPKDADMLRAGGHLKEYTPPSERAMSTERPVMQMGGDLTIDNRGDIEFMGYNPETAKTGASGFIGISRGPSHDNGGFNIKYAGNHVEIEGGETIMEKKDGGPVGDTSLNVLGNLKTGILGEAMLQGVNEKTVAKLLKGRKIKDVKYKHLGNDIAKKTKSLNKQGDKYSELASSIENSSIFDKLALNSAQAGLMGINMQYKDLNTLQNNLMMGQAAVNDTAEEMGLVADDLAKGKVKVDKKAMKEAAKFGKMISAQTGIRTNQRKRAELRISKEDADSSTKKLEKLKALRTVPSGQQKGEVFYGKVTQADFEDMMARNPWYDWENFDPSNPDDVEDFQMAFNREAEKLGVSTRLRVDGALGEQTVSAESLYGEQKPVSTIPVGNLNINELKKLDTTGQASVSTTPTFSVTPYKKDPLLDLVGQVLPYLRTPDQEELDPRQLTGEMYALSTNELEPVQAQTIQPQLSVPYDISLQDILNENEATFRSQQRLMGYNPAAQSQLNAQKYAANQKVLAEQFRLNQAMKDQVYRENRNLLNQFGLKNLEILDRQYVRQAEAKSKTKAVTQAALNSIGDKFMRNQLENRTLAVMENMFNYRYDPMFRTVNTNAPFQPQIPTVYVGNNAQATVPQGTVPAAAPSASQVQPLIPINFEQRPYTMEELSGGIYSGKTGVKVDKKKSLNSSVLKAFKNL